MVERGKFQKIIQIILFYFYYLLKEIYILKIKNKNRLIKKIINFFLFYF